MPVEINITDKIYDFIDPSTGKKITEEEFAKKYPGVGVGGYAPNTRQASNGEKNETTKKE